MPQKRSYCGRNSLYGKR